MMDFQLPRIAFSTALVMLNSVAFAMTHADDVQTSVSSPAELRVQVASIIERVRRGELSDFDAQVELTSFGKRAFDEIARFAQDADPLVRQLVLKTTYRLDTQRAVAVQFSLISDPNDLVGPLAMGQLLLVCKNHLEAVKQAYTPLVHRPILLRMASTLGPGGGIGSMILLAALGDREATPTLRAVLEREANRTQPVVPGVFPESIRRVVVRNVLPDGAQHPLRAWSYEIVWHEPVRLHEAALKALFQLGEAQAERDVRAWLRGDDPTSCSIAIGCVLEARRRDLAPAVVARLADAREGRRSFGWRTGPHRCACKMWRRMRCWCCSRSTPRR